MAIGQIEMLDTAEQIARVEPFTLAGTKQRVLAHHPGCARSPVDRLEKARPEF